MLRNNGHVGQSALQDQTKLPTVLDAERIFATLNAHDVDYVVIGALGATLHGSPLRTDDVDICPSADRSNLERLAAAIKDLGAREWDPRKDEEVERDFDAEMLSIDRLWLLVTDYGPLDLVFEPAGTRGYRDLVRDAVNVEIDGLEIPVASLTDIIRSKEATGRETDRQQLPTLRRLLQRLEEQ